MKRRLALVAAAIAALTAGVTYAATALTRTAAATNVVQACVKVPNGDVRIVDSPTQCHRDERSMTWSVQGPKGDKGDKGDTGATGAAGLSVQPATLAVGDANCPFGGSSFTVGLLLPTFACNGAPGKDGANGKDGKDGTSFTSIDGLNGLACTTGGQPGTVVVGSGAGNTITLTCQLTGGGSGGGGEGGTTGDCSGPAPTYANATTSCSNGTYTFTCNAGYADADRDPANGCEVNLMTDVNNCGAVGNKVVISHGTGACVGGQATIAACDSGWYDANGNPADGCESNLPTCESVTHLLGIGGATYVSCSPIGPPSEGQARQAAVAWIGGRSGFSIGDAICGNPLDATDVVEATDGSTWAAWAYSGQNAGHAASGSGGTVFCPTSGDPIWN